MIDLPTVLKVKRIQWVIRVLKGHNDDNWKILPLQYFKCLDKYFGMDFFALRVTMATDLINKEL